MSMLAVPQRSRCAQSHGFALRAVVTVTFALRAVVTGSRYAQARGVGPSFAATRSRCALPLRTGYAEAPQVAGAGTGNPDKFCSPDSQWAGVCAKSAKSTERGVGCVARRTDEGGSCRGWDGWSGDELAH